MASSKALVDSLSIDVADLGAFHAVHFPTAGSVPVQEGEDYLGYYADGTRRTLTDEQIAIFRHSEIQTLIRARRHDREQTEDEGEIVDDAKYEAPASPPRSSIKTKSKDASKKLHLQNQTGGHNRSRADHNRNRTHRRIARELDEVHETAVDLDY